jgi:hypothetical protein
MKLWYFIQFVYSCEFFFYPMEDEIYGYFWLLKKFHKLKILFKDVYEYEDSKNQEVIIEKYSFTS